MLALKTWCLGSKAVLERCLNFPVRASKKGSSSKNSTIQNGLINHGPKQLMTEKLCVVFFTATWQAEVISDSTSYISLHVKKTLPRKKQRKRLTLFRRRRLAKQKDKLRCAARDSIMRFCGREEFSWRKIGKQRSSVGMIISETLNQAGEGVLGYWNCGISSN